MERVLTVGVLREQISGYPDDAEVVITVNEGHEVWDAQFDDTMTYYASPNIGHGWKVSNVVELTLGEFATG